MYQVPDKRVAIVPDRRGKVRLAFGDGNAEGSICHGRA